MIAVVRTAAVWRGGLDEKSNKAFRPGNWPARPL